MKRGSREKSVRPESCSSPQMLLEPDKYQEQLRCTERSLKDPNRQYGTSPEAERRRVRQQRDATLPTRKLRSSTYQRTVSMRLASGDAQIFAPVCLAAPTATSCCTPRRLKGERAHNTRTKPPVADWLEFRDLPARGKSPIQEARRDRPSSIPNRDLEGEPVQKRF